MGLVLFFDGECGFCKRSVRKVLQLDDVGVVEFAPLQGALSKQLGLEKFAEKKAGTMVIINEADGERFFKSDALIILGESLGGFWNVLARLFAVVPKGMRDWCYDFIAKNRHRIAWQGDACGLPDEGLRKRMRD